MEPTTEQQLITKMPKPFTSKTHRICKTALFASLYGSGSKDILKKYKISKRTYKKWLSKRCFDYKNRKELNFKQVWN